VGAGFWFRWAWRDLRTRAFQVIAIAAIIALGAGIYAGLASVSVWRRQSLDASFAALHGHDVHVSVLNVIVDRARLVSAIRAGARDAISGVETHLIARAPARAVHDGVAVPAAGEVVGTDLRAPSAVDRWRVMAGRDLTSHDTESVLLDAHFARANDLPSHGRIRIGNTDVRYVGLALSPAYLNLNTTAGEAIQGQATRAVVYAPVELVESIADAAPGQVNDAVVATRAGTSVEHTAAAIQRSLATRLPDVPVAVTSRRDEPSLGALYDEISSEQYLFDVFALLIIAGAGFAVFTLTKRVVEAQRREIGIAMSLGVRPARIAIRTMLFAGEISVLGVVLGIAAGWLIATWVLSVVRSNAPLPYWTTPFQSGAFGRAALLGLSVPLIASAIPVWRAVRVQPVEALLPAHLRAGGHRLTHLLRRVRLPGTIVWQAPLRRIVRAPARSCLTILAIAFVMAPLLAAFGATDSARKTIDTGEQLLTGNTGDRLVVDLIDYQPTNTALVTGIVNAPQVAEAAPGLNTGGYLIRDGKSLGVSISMGDLHDGLAVPPTIAALRLAPGGIVISRKAASDLGLDIGETVTLRHPKTVGTGFRFVETKLPVRAVHTSPYRFVAYMDLSDEKIMGLDGIVNTVKVRPRASVSIDRVQRDMSGRSGVASALPTSELSRTMRDILSVVGNLFIILQIVIAALAFLVAYNASKIGTEERAREHATMFAFGIRVRRVALIAVAESLALAVVGVALALGFGTAVLRWILATVFPAAVPDLAVLQDVSPMSYLVTIGIAVAAALAAPWLNVRRLRTMNIPATLRYVE
jgi:putative ABC transport system permease protein